MRLKYTIKTAISGIKTHKLRSSLTILGIVIGITAIILVMSVGRGAQNLILSQVEGLGSKTIFVAPGREPRGPSDVAQTFIDSLKEKDLEALKRKENVPALRNIMPILFGAASASYGSETYRPNIIGASGLVSKIFDLSPEEGSFFGEEDVRARGDVVVLGYKVKAELFGEERAIGKKIKIKGRTFRVIGVLPKKGQVSFFNFDEVALLPYTTAQQYIFGVKHFHRFVIEAESEEAISRTVRDVELTLRESHGITDPSKDDFFIETQADLASRLSTITNILTLLLVSIATISLVVGGIGIMNIMLVSVTERTREIGLRKALGATSRDVLRQFLLEAVMLTAAGGAIGIILGALFAFLASLILSQALSISWQFVFPISAVALGLGVSSAVGLIFGLYPARQASKKSPIEALRYE